MKDDVTSPAPAPAKTAKPRAKAKAPAAPEVKTVKPKAPPKPKAVDAAPVPGDAEKAEARKLELENAKVQGVMEHMQREAKQAELAAKTQALWEKAHPNSEKEFEPMSDAQKFEFFRLQREKDQDAEAFAKAAEAAKLATVGPKTAEQTFAAARAEQAIKPEEVENSIEAGPVREVTADMAHDRKSLEAIRKNMEGNMIAPVGAIDHEEASADAAKDVAALESIKDPEIRNRALTMIAESAYAQPEYESAMQRQAPEVIAKANAAAEAEHLAGQQEQDPKDADLVAGIAATASNMKSARRGEVSFAEASEFVASDVSNFRQIKSAELRAEAMQIMDESRVAQVQYRIALDRQAPAVGKEIDASRQVEQGVPRTPEQGADNFKARSAEAPTFADHAAADRAAEDRSKAIPDAVKAKYIQVENDYFFQDKKPAFIDRGTKLATKGENPEVIASLVAIAKARGWGNVTVKGTEDFRRAAWHEASLNGLEVAGYTPTKVELAHLAAAKDTIAKAKPENTLEKGRAAELAKAPEAPVQAASAKTPATMRDIVKEAPAAPPVAAKAPPVAFPAGTVGKLVEHGKAPYQHYAPNEQSYFVTVETERGNKTLWGIDLGRAMEKSGAKIGETISLNSKTVEGRKAKEWTVGSLDKASSFASSTRDASVKEYPDLAGVHGTAAAAQAFFKQHMPGHEDRVAAIGKSIMAGNIAAGKDVPAVQLREVQKVKAVDQERTPKTDDRERA